MPRSLLFIAALTLASACTIHRHYHQAPTGGAYHPADGDAPEVATRHPGHAIQDADRPLPPEYAKPDYDDQGDAYDRYDRYEDDVDDGYRSYSRDHRYEHRCECDHERRVRPSAPFYPRKRHPGPVVPDNPVEWLE